MHARVPGRTAHAAEAVSLPTIPSWPLGDRHFSLEDGSCPVRAGGSRKQKEQSLCGLQHWFSLLPYLFLAQPTAPPAPLGQMERSLDRVIAVHLTTKTAEGGGRQSPAAGNAQRVFPVLPRLVAASAPLPQFSSGDCMWPPVWLVLKPGLSHIAPQAGWPGHLGRAKSGLCWVSRALRGIWVGPQGPQFRVYQEAVVWWVLAVLTCSRARLPTSLQLCSAGGKICGLSPPPQPHSSGSRSHREAGPGRCLPGKSVWTSNT